MVSESSLPRAAMLASIREEASLQSGVGSAHLQAAREWLPGAADLAGDPELREFADDVRESLERGAGAVKKGD